MERTAMEQSPALVSLKPRTLAQAKGVFRSSYRFSLRQDCQQRALQDSRVLVQASPPCLSEVTPRPKVRFLAWATTAATCLRLSCILTQASPFCLSRQYLAQNESSPPERELECELGPGSASLAQVRQVRLGENIGSRHYSPCNSHTYISKQYNQASYAFTVTHKLKNRETIARQATIALNK